MVAFDPPAGNTSIRAVRPSASRQWSIKHRQKTLEFGFSLAASRRPSAHSRIHPFRGRQTARLGFPSHSLMSPPTASTRPANMNSRTSKST